eukprot:gb/GFBE01020306.1/.p1 GENE.gb/GFBE01020306.1/~~gb/GFBE01020306.1/.p1  ORF type:complete len:386 (+),score=68.84 gb/GFBE01020306.1/:1-1158(+)
MGAASTQGDTETDAATSRKQQESSLQIFAPATNAGVRSVLRSLCEGSGAGYALLWTFCSGRHCVASAWVQHGSAQVFAEESCKVMLAAGQGAVGRTFGTDGHEFNDDVASLSSAQFVRAELARAHGVRSVAVFALGAHGVVELGSCSAQWRAPVVLGTASLQLAPSRAPAWQAVLWKQSRFLRRWRQRHFTLQEAGEHWQLDSWDVATASLTGSWKLDRCMPYLDVSPKHGFAAAMWLLGGPLLAADSQTGAEAIEELATIFNGRFMRRNISCSTGTESEVASSAASESGESSELEIKISTPQCENCGMEEAKGRLVAKLSGCDSLTGRWLCKGCFLSSWMETCQGAEDGRLQARPQWMALSASGDLVDSTPPDVQRYSPLHRRR